jgi:hypothetical protein
MAVLEYDYVWLSIVLVLVTCMGFIVGPGLDTNDWDTISTMVSRDDKLVRGFAMACVLILACQLYYVYHMLLRWQYREKKLRELAAKKTAGDDSSLGLRHYPLSLGAVYVGTISSVAGTIGFGIVSMDISEEQHTRFAGVAFGSVLLYLAGFLALARELEDVNPPEPPHNLDVARVSWLAAVVCLVLLGAGYPFYWEYILVFFSCVCAVTLTIPAQHRLFVTVGV